MVLFIGINTILFYRLSIPCLPIWCFLCNLIVLLISTCFRCFFINLREFTISECSCSMFSFQDRSFALCFHHLSRIGIHPLLNNLLKRAKTTTHFLSHITVRALICLSVCLSTCLSLCVSLSFSKQNDFQVRTT